MACIDQSSGVLVSFIKRGYNTYAMREQIYSLVRNTESHAPIRKEKVLRHLFLTLKVLVTTIDALRHF